MVQTNSMCCDQMQCRHSEIVKNCTGQNCTDCKLTSSLKYCISMHQKSHLHLHVFHSVTVSVMLQKNRSIKAVHLICVHMIADHDCFHGTFIVLYLSFWSWKVMVTIVPIFIFLIRCFHRKKTSLERHEGE